MPKAVWKDKVIAESDETKMVEGNRYFPPKSVKKQYLEETDYRTTCPWKGKANYYNIKINGDVNENAAWYYPEPKPAASEIKDYVAFWKGVEIK